MTIATQQPLSEEDLVRAADEGGVEYVDGELCEKPMSVEERRVMTRVSWLLMIEATRQGAGDVIAEAAFRCYPNDPRKFRKPDVCFIRAGRVRQSFADINFIPIPADLAVEVISPNDKVYDVDEKVREYLEAGFDVVWVVNPVEKTVVIRRRNRSAQFLYADDEITGEDFLPGFRCKVAAFFE